MKAWAIAALLCLSSLVHGQVVPVSPSTFPCTTAAGVPSQCTFGTNLSLTGSTLNASNSATPAWSAVTPATNTQGAFYMGSGASLAATGSGTITATAMAASGLTGTLPCGAVPTWTGDFTTSGCTATVGAVNGTTVPVNAASNQVLVTTANATGAWKTMPQCLDTAGQHLNYNQSSNTWTCGSTGGTGSPTFTNVQGGTNTTSSMVVGSGASLGTSGTGTITANNFNGSGLAQLSAVNVCAFSTSGFCGDTVKVQANVSCSPGSSVITVTRSLPSSYIGANAVVGGCGSYAAQNQSGGYNLALVGTPGTGYTPNLINGVAVGTGSSCVLTNANCGDTLTVSGGTCTTQPTVAVLTVTGGGATGPIDKVAVVNPGVCSVAPSGNATLTGGTGTGAAVTLNYVGLPLTGTVTAVGTNQFTISSTPVATISAQKNWWAVGHDDAPAINAAIASGAGSIYLPVQGNPSWSSNVYLGYGQYSNISLPTTYSFVMNCNNGSLTALTSGIIQVTAQQTSSNISEQGNSISNCTLDGMGVAAYNYFHAASGWADTFDVFLNATASNILHGDGTNNAQNNKFVNFQIHNELSLVPAGAWGQNKISNENISGYLYNCQTNSSDNQIVGLLADTAQGGLLAHCANWQVTNAHIYLIFARSQYDFESNYKEIFVSIEGDKPSPGQAGAYVAGGLLQLQNWQFYLPGNATANADGAWDQQTGIYIASDNQNVIGCGTLGGNANTGPANQWNVATSNTYYVHSAGTYTTNTIAPCITAGLTTISAATTSNSLTTQAASAPFWGAAGLGLSLPATSYTDTTSNTSITRESLYAIAAPTLVGTSAFTVGQLDTLYLAQPLAGTNVTATNRWSLDTAGGILDGGALTVQGLGTFSLGLTESGGNVTLNSNANAISIGAGTNTSTVNIGNGANTVAVGGAETVAGLLTANASETVAGGTLLLSSGADLSFTGNISTASALSSGIGIVTTSPNYTDTSGTGGTISNAYAWRVPAMNLETTTNTTYTNVASLYVPAPTCSAGGGGTPTCTNLFSISTPGQVAFTGGGSWSGGTISINNGNNNAVNIGAGTNTSTVSIGSTNNTVALGGNLKMNGSLYASTTLPTYSSGFNTTGYTLPSTGTTAAFQVIVGTGTATTTGVLTMPSAPNGWACSVSDVTTPASHNVVQTGSGVASVTVTDYSRTAGTAQNMANSDKLNFVCGAF